MGPCERTLFSRGNRSRGSASGPRRGERIHRSWPVSTTFSIITAWCGNRGTLGRSRRRWRPSPARRWAGTLDEGGRNRSAAIRRSSPWRATSLSSDRSSSATIPGSAVFWIPLSHFRIRPEEIEWGGVTEGRDSRSRSTRLLEACEDHVLEGRGARFRDLPRR